MVTVRTYWNPVDAALAKSVLDNYEIPFEILHENVNLYSQAQFAVPIRLVVDEDQASRATYFLNDDLEKAGEIEVSEDATDTSLEATAPEVTNRNPWELLVLAFYLLVPAICVLAAKYPTVEAKSSRARYLIASVTVIHFLSWLSVLFAVLLVILYFRMRRSSKKAVP